MSNQSENQQYKKPQAPSSRPETGDDDFQKQDVDQGRKVSPEIKEKGGKPGSVPDDDHQESE